MPDPTDTPRDGARRTRRPAPKRPDLDALIKRSVGHDTPRDGDAERSASRAAMEAIDCVAALSPAKAWDKLFDSVLAQIYARDAALRDARARIAALETALRRLASPEAFVVSRGTTEEETARMKFAERALAALDAAPDGAGAKMIGDH